MKITGIRVSSIDPNEQRQITEMKKFDAEKIFIEKQSVATITHLSIRAEVFGHDCRTETYRIKTTPGTRDKDCESKWRRYFKKLQKTTILLDKQFIELKMKSTIRMPI